jgi:predicted HAD superfamily Cof-like phosphohydrolase
LTREDIVKEFHEVFGHSIDQPFEKDLVQLRLNLISEEVTELMQEFFSYEREEWLEVDRVSKARILKEMADIQYVLSGMAVAFGLPLDKAFKLVHESNMSKLGEDGKPIYRDDGKVLKGPNYKPPVMENLL